MRNYIFTFLFLIATENLMAQISVKQLDREIRNEVKGKLTTLRTGEKATLLVVHVFKSDNRIFSVMKREKFGSGKQADSVLAYQFGYINDTLLRIWYSRLTLRDSKNGYVAAYLSNNKIVSIDKKGDI